MAETKQIIYELHVNKTDMPFVNEADAINALVLLGSYHDLDIDKEAVKKSLDEHDLYVAYPLAVGKKSCVTDMAEKISENNNSCNNSVLIRQNYEIVRLLNEILLEIELFRCYMKK